MYKILPKLNVTTTESCCAIFPSGVTVVIELESVLLSSCVWETLGIFGLLIFGNLCLSGAAVVVFLPHPSTLIPSLFLKVSQPFGEPENNFYSLKDFSFSL